MTEHLRDVEWRVHYVSETPLREPLLLPAVALMAGIAVSRFLAFGSGELVIHGAAMILLALAAWRKNALWLARICVLLAVFFAGVLLAILKRPGPPPVLDVHSREVVILEGCVVEPPVLFEDRQQFTLELAPEARVRVSLHLKQGERPPDLRYGQRVELEARVRRPRNFGNPGSFDYEGYLARQQIYWTASAATGAPIRVLGGDCGKPAPGALFRLRSAALDRLEKLYAGKPYETAMMQAVLVGEKSRVEKVWTDHFRFTGTYHALVISGLHLTVLAGLVLLLLRLFPLSEGAALLAAVLFGWLYALITGGQAPVVRAASGLTLYLAARYFCRRHRLLNLLAAVTIGFLVLDPSQIFEASFQLSFLAVAAIAAFAVPLLDGTSGAFIFGLRGPADRDRDIYLAPKVAQFRVELRLAAETVALWTRIRERWVVATLAGTLRIALFAYELAVVSAAVQIGLVLPMIVYFRRVSISGLTANLAVVPLTSLVVPAGFLAVVTGWGFPATIAGWLLGLTRRIVDWHAGWEPAWRIPDPPLWMSVAFAASLILFAIAARWAPRWRWSAAGASAFLLVILLWHPFPVKTEPGLLEFTAIDVGQGDSFFVSFPDGKLALIDGGGIPGRGGRSRVRLDIGEDVISPYLWSRSIRRLDAVIMSHGHEDHMGGLIAVVENFRPRELWVGPQAQTEVWKRLRNAAHRNGTILRFLRNDSQFKYGNTQVETLSNTGDTVLAEQAADDDSLVLRLSYGSRSLLLMGDASRQVEQALAERRVLGKTDILKVAHHGSKTSTAEQFVDTLRPIFGVVSAGFENSYGHPHPSVVERLRRFRTTVLRTDQLGMISIHTDGGHRMWLNTAQWSAQPRRLLGVF